MSDDDDQRYESLDPDEPWDGQLANDLVGSTLFVGIRYIDHAGEIVRREQVFGTVRSISPGAGIKIIQSSGKMRTLPPCLEAIEVGEADQYQLSDDDELVENPDFVAWLDAISPPPH